MSSSKIDELELVWFDFILYQGYLMPNPLYTYILNVYDL